MEKVVSVPLVINNCFPISTTSISFVDHCRGLPYFPLLCCLCRCSLPHQHRFAPAGASLVPSPIMATILPVICSLAYIVHFVFRFCFGNKSSTPALLAIYFRSKRVITGHHHRFTPIFLKRSKRSWMPGLIMSCNSITPFITAFVLSTSGYPVLGNLFTLFGYFTRNGIAIILCYRFDGIKSSSS